MRLKFEDSTVALTYLQIKLSEQYNPDITINNTYYKMYNNKYGFAHYVAKYLNTMYPPLDDAYSIDLPDSTFDSSRTLTDSISIMNYYLCDNKGNKLENNLVGSNIDITKNSIFQQIYGNDICAIFNIDDPPLLTSASILTAKDENDKLYIVSPYLEPLWNRIVNLGYVEKLDNIAKTERIYNMSQWNIDKGICELDDLVMSYLLGRTITPNSSMEDIYYVQQLMIGSQIDNKDRGIWYSPSGNLTKIIMDYQKLKVNQYTTDPIFVTGYFDIFTEASILKDRGEQTYGIRGL